MAEIGHPGALGGETGHPSASLRTNPEGDADEKHPLRMIAWETTRACNLDCVHCRAAANREALPGTFTTQEALKFIDDVVAFANPVIILTGGEPLMRPDIFEIAKYGTGKGLRMVMSPNGTLITPEITQKMKVSGIQRCSISIDGPDAKSHDEFRRVPGAFEGAMRGVEYLKQAGIAFQINTTVTKHNLKDLQKILETVKKIGAAAWHVFLLVPTGRAENMKDEEISPQEYEDALNWFYKVQQTEKLPVKATCAPHYYRIIRQRAKAEGVKLELPRQGFEAMTRGCLGGISFCFVSYKGDVYPCGYLEALAGNVREESFEKIWKRSSLFTELRDYKNLKGKCGVCEYVNICGGCRARAYAITGDFLDEEPYCVYQPVRGC